MAPLVLIFPAKFFSMNDISDGLPKNHRRVMITMSYAYNVSPRQNAVRYNRIRPEQLRNTALLDFSLEHFAHIDGNCFLEFMKQG